MIEGKPRLMVIGLDGAAPDLLFPWIQAGYLPHLERIFSDGFHGRLRSTVHPQSPQAWSSIYTGVNPGSHGIFGFSTGPFSDHPGEFVTALNRRARDFWSFPEFRNTRIGLINLPFTYPVTAVNGFVLSGFGTPSLSKKYSYPAGISQISKRLIGRYPITGADISTRSADGYARSLWDMDRRRAELAPHLMDRFNIDILFIVFESCDRIQHALWNELDVLSPWTRANDEGIKSTFIFKTYKLIDDLCGQLLGSIPRDCAVMIVSDHGAGPCYGIFNLAEWLIQNGFLKQTKGPISGRFSSTSRKILTSLRSRIPSTAVAMMSPWLRTTWRKHLYSVSQLNLAQSYALPHESFGSIYLNSKHEGESYRIGEEICSGLLQLKDPYNQAPLFSKFIGVKTYTAEYVYLTLQT